MQYEDNPDASPDGEDLPPLSAVIVYDEIRAGQRAMTTLTRLAEDLRREPRFHYHLWQLALLDEPGSRFAATADLKTAHVLIVSLSYPKRDLPESLQAWINQGVELRGEQAFAVVMLFYDGEETDGAALPSAELAAGLATGLAQEKMISVPRWTKPKG